MMLLDEFTALGRIPIIAEAISYLPGYNVRVVLVIQTPAQLREVYGIHNAETMLKSLAARIVFAPKDFPDAREISDELGFTTVRVRSTSKPVGLTFEKRGGRGRSQTLSDQRRALLLPQEVKELGAEDAIVFYEGLRPIRCRKVRYFAERQFRRRLVAPPRSPVPPGSEAAHTPTPQLPIGVQTSPRQDSEGQAGRKEEVVIRGGTVEDVERIGSLTEEDFADPIPLVKPPDHDGPPTDNELHAEAARFVAQLHKDREELYGR